MSRPPIVPNTTTSGIALDPRTLQRVIPESRRPDGSLRQAKKVRAGYTPPEDVRPFRGTRQVQADATALPKGHIVGWTPPTAAGPVPVKTALSKSAKKNEKRKEKRKEEKDKELEMKIKESWDDDDDDDLPPAPAPSKAVASKGEEGKAGDEAKTGADADELADELEKLDVR